MVFGFGHRRKPWLPPQAIVDPKTWSKNYSGTKPTSPVNIKPSSFKKSIQKKPGKLKEEEKSLFADGDKSDFELNLNWTQLSSEEFLSLATESIEVSTAFQRYLQENSVHPNILKLVEDTMNELIVNRFGCHVLRILLQKSPTIYDRLVNLVKREFAVYCCNQFSNKVIQALAELDYGFSIHCLYFFD